MVPNTDERSKQIYADWFERYKGTDRVTGSRTADMRSALVDYFREQGRILIATEAAPRAPAVLLAGGKLRPAVEPRSALNNASAVVTDMASSMMWWRSVF